jgi:hypothetical protein
MRRGSLCTNEDFVQRNRPAEACHKCPRSAMELYHMVTASFDSSTSFLQRVMFRDAKQAGEVTYRATAQ